MHYYIDGYNLLFRIFGPKDYQLRAQREKLIDTLREKVHFLNLNVTLVFDSHYFEGDATRSNLENLAIVFTSQGETADEYILAQLEEASHLRQEIVVTSDRQLGAMARHCGAKTELVEEFMHWVHSRFKKRRQQQKTAVRPVVSSQPIVVAQKLPLLAAEATPEHSFDYYLAEFEKRLQTEESPPKKMSKKPTNKRVKSPRLRQESVEKPLSEMERWQRIFESKMQQDSDQ